MRIHGVNIENFLSFQKFEWHAIHENLNIVVGPNGVGKTNLFIAIRTVLDAFENSSSSFQRVANLGHTVHRAEKDQTVRIALNVELNTAWEEALLRTFLAAALSEPQGYNVPGMQQGLERLADFWHHYLLKIDISFLLTGRLVFTFDPMARWSLHYESLSPDFPFSWNLSSYVDTGFTVAASPHDWQGSFLAIQRSYDEHDADLFNQYIMGLSEAPPVPDLRQVLNGNNIRLTVNGQNPEYRKVHRELARLAGIEHFTINSTYSGYSVFNQILQRALLFTDNIRRAPIYTATLEQLKQPIVDLKVVNSYHCFCFR